MSKKTTLYFLSVLIFFTVIHIVLAAIPLLKGDIVFHTDTARDFLLLDDLQERKLVLIGPRSSGESGLFHGPLWMYLNFPAFLLSNGDPVVQGWYWLGLLILFYTLSYVLVKKLFGVIPAWITVALLSSQFTIGSFKNAETSGFYNPHGALFLTPLLFFLIYKYVSTHRIIFLIFTLFAAGCMIQFQIAFGAPMLIITSLVAFYEIVRSKNYSHLTAWVVLLIPASTYLLFDIRHNFSQTRAILFNPGPVEVVPFLERLYQRIGISFITGLHFFKSPQDALNIAFGYLMAFGIFAAFKKKVNTTIYILALLYYFGYFLLSTIHPGWLMYYYWFPLLPLPFIVFASIYRYLPFKLYAPALFFILLINLFFSIQRLNVFIGESGSHKESWKFQKSIAEYVFEKAGNREFGFFIYAPDIYAYGSKYPFTYISRRVPQARMSVYQKKPLTFIVVEPPPKQMPWMTADWWIQNKLHITDAPLDTKEYGNGFRILTYQLSPKSFEKDIEPGINDWIYFR